MFICFSKNIYYTVNIISYFCDNITINIFFGGGFRCHKEAAV